MLGVVGRMGATAPARALGIGTGGAFAIEWLLSFALMLVIAAVATDERVAGGFGAIAIGLTVGFCAMMGGPLTGASMNPARSFGPALVGGFWNAHWIYWLAPITGMLAAAQTYELLRGTALPRMNRGTHSDRALGLEGPLDIAARAVEAP